jgi:hypothetical protein
VVAIDLRIHHWVGPKHLPRYIDEATWRYNRRDVKDGSRIAKFLVGSMAD